MKILITGGQGFIGKNLFAYLKGIYQIENPGRQKLNLLDPEQVFQYLKEKRFDVIIHTAVYDAVAVGSTKDPAKVLEFNLKMFFNLVRAENFFGKMIYFGSGAEFNRSDWKAKMREDYFDTHVPADQYGLSKYIMTQFALSHKKIYNLRLFGVFGKNDDWKTRVIPNLCCLAIRNQSLIIDQNKDYDYLYVEDLAKIVRWFIEHRPKKKVYNVCTGRTIDFLTIARKIIKISGKKLALKVIKRGLGKEYSGNNHLLLSELKGFKFTPLDVSLKLLYHWYDQNKDFLNEHQSGN